MTDAPAPHLRLDDQLCFAVYTAAHAFTRFYKPLLQTLGVTYPQYLVLLALWETDDLSVSAIGERLMLDSGTLSPLLKRLEAMGLVTRTRDPADERQVRITLTQQGKSLRAIAEGFPAQILAASNCSTDEIAALRDALFLLQRQLDGRAQDAHLAGGLSEANRACLPLSVTPAKAGAHSEGPPQAETLQRGCRPAPA